MTTVESILESMKQGANILVTRNVQPKIIQGNEVYEINELVLTTFYGEYQPLPTTLFPDLFPYLTEVMQDELNTVYALYVRH